MSYATRKQAVASLREFAPAWRDSHKIVKFYSETHGTYRYARVLTPAGRK